jgi:hypothetical protein
MKLSTNLPDLRLLFPMTPKSYADRFDLSTKAGLAKLGEILPIIAEHEAELLANPADIEGIIHRHNQQRAATVQERRVVEAVSSLPANEQEIVMYNKRLWPRLPTDTMSYTYFDEYERQLRFVHKDAASRAQLIFRPGAKAQSKGRGRNHRSRPVCQRRPFQVPRPTRTSRGIVSPRR